MEVRGARQLGDGLLAGVDEIGVDVRGIRCRAHAEHPVLGVQDDLELRGQEVRHQRRRADPEVDVRALGDVGGDACREFIAADARGHWSTSVRLQHRQSTGTPFEVHSADELTVVEPRALPHRDDAVDEDAGSHDGLGVERSQRHDLVDLHHRRRGGDRHDRTEVARGLAVDEVAPAVALQRGDRGRSPPGSGTRARSRGRRSSRASLPSASCVPTPVGEKNAPMPAPAARMRSARLPCGTSSSSILPSRYSPSNTQESC